MPVIIEPADWPIWLGETEGDVGALLRPAPEDVLRVWPVNKKVGNVKNDGPELLEPHASSEQMRTLLWAGPVIACSGSARGPRFREARRRRSQPRAYSAAHVIGHGVLATMTCA
jgi:hypothetical protein